jgi:hypothetical protein
MKKVFLIIFLGNLMFFPLFSLAAGLVPCGGPGEPACQFCHFFVMLDEIIDFVLFTLVPPIAVLMLAIGGAMFIFAYFSGGEQTLSQAKKLITSVFLGLVIIFAAWILINLFFQIIGVAEWTTLQTGWFRINCPNP